MYSLPLWNVVLAVHAGELESRVSLVTWSWRCWGSETVGCNGLETAAAAETYPALRMSVDRILSVMAHWIWLSRAEVLPELVSIVYLAMCELDGEAHPPGSSENYPARLGIYKRVQLGLRTVDNF